MSLQNQSKRIYSKIIESDSSNKLYPVTNQSIFKFDAPCAFVNKNKDTIIPFGKFTVFETDTMINFTFVNEIDKGFVGINQKGEVLFDAYTFGDLILDKYSEGLIRIKQNGKIGYANKEGKIIIKPIYRYAEPFSKGKAKVSFDCKSNIDSDEHINYTINSWFYINKKGEKIKRPITYKG